MRTHSTFGASKAPNYVCTHKAGREMQHDTPACDEVHATTKPAGFVRGALEKERGRERGVRQITSARL